MIDGIDSSSDVPSSIARISDSRPRVTARRTNEKAEVPDVADGPPNRQAEGIDEPARPTHESDGLTDILDERTNEIDATTVVIEGLLDLTDGMPDEPAEVIDQPAKRSELPDGATQRP